MPSESLLEDIDRIVVSKGDRVEGAKFGKGSGVESTASPPASFFSWLESLPQDLVKSFDFFWCGNAIFQIPYVIEYSVVLEMSVAVMDKCFYLLFVIWFDGSKLRKV